jgi:nitroreductase
MVSVSEAMLKRHSCRAFLDRPVESGKIERILKIASRAPSGANMQPWRVAVVSGGTKLRIAREMEAQFRGGTPGHPDYRYYPEHWSEPYQSRRFACGMQLYSALGIEREDKERRMEQWIANYHSFGAPVVLYFYMESHLEAGSYMDLGMFLQSVMLAAIEEGLATCPQEALAEYPEIVKQALGIGDGFVLLCGMALGYEDTSAPINHYRTPRVGLDELATFYTQ